MDFLDLGLFGLFLICFLAATILPLASEAVLIAFLFAGYDPIASFLAASIGNTLGGTTNYFLGMLGHPEKLKARLQHKDRFEKFESWIHRYGYWLGLLSWTPFIGDPLTIALGYFRVPFFPLLILMAAGKFARYYVIVFLFDY